MLVGSYRVSETARKIFQTFWKLISENKETFCFGLVGVVWVSLLFHDTSIIFRHSRHQ